MHKPIKMQLIFILIIIISSGLISCGMNSVSESHKNSDLPDLNNKLQDGDLIFQTSQSAQSKAIQLATKSKYSHMGLIILKDNQVFVLEAVQPVKYTLFENWIKHGENGHYVIKRLKDSDKILTTDVINKLNLVAERFIGKNYDIYFEWSDNRIYCSELVWKIYKESADIEIGKLEKLKDFDLTNEIVQKKLAERFGENIPLEETVISPANMFESEILEPVYEQ